MDSAIPGNNPIIPGLLLTALFTDTKTAESAYLDAVKLGHKSENISVFLSEETRNNSFFIKNDPSTATIDNKTVEGAGVGGAVGSALGALAGVIIAAGTLITLPGIGLVVSGPLVAALAGAGAGGIAGSLLGSLVKAGIPEEQASSYEAGVKTGGIVIAVNTFSIEEYASLKKEWQRY